MVVVFMEAVLAEAAGAAVAGAAALHDGDRINLGAWTAITLRRE